MLTVALLLVIALGEYHAASLVCLGAVAFAWWRA